MVTTTSKKGGRGFASMDPDKLREIASKGGRTSQGNGTAHHWTSEEAQAAGRKGGSVGKGVRRTRQTEEEKEEEIDEYV